MASLPIRESVDRRWLTPAEYEALLLSGAETLCPSTDWEEDASRGPVYAYRSDGRDFNEKLVILSDTLHRLHERNEKRKGLILIEQTQRDSVPPLRTVLVDPTIRSHYVGPFSWKTPMIDVETRTCQDRTNVTRQLGRGVVAKYYIARVRRIVPMTTDTAPFAIMGVQQSGSEIVFDMRPSSTPPQRDHVVQIRGVHDAIDGRVIVTRATENGFRIAAPRKIKLPGQIYSRSEESVTGAEGIVVYKLDRLSAVYHVRFFGFEEPPPRLFTTAVSSSSQSSGRSVPFYRHEPINPNFHSMSHEARRMGVPRHVPSAFHHPIPHAAMPKEMAPQNPFVEIQRKEAVAKLRLDGDRKKALSFLFSPEKAEASLRRMAERFGRRQVRDAFHTASQPPPFSPGQLLRELQQRRTLIQTSHQQTILRKIANGENWLFRLPRTDKVATYFEMIKLLLDIQPNGKAVIVTAAKQKATELNAVLQVVQNRFHLRRLSAEVVVGKTGAQGKRSQSVTSPSNANVIIATHGMFQNMLCQRQWNLTQFRILIWDDCEKATGSFSGKQLIQQYRQLPSDAQSSLKIYAFTSHFHVAGGKAVYLSELCENLSIPLRNHYLSEPKGLSLECRTTTDACRL